MRRFSPANFGLAFSSLTAQKALCSNSNGKWQALPYTILYGDIAQKGVSIDGKVVHENFYNLLTETMKYCRHTPLKSSRCITQTKRHTPISISTEGHVKVVFS